MDNNSGLFTLFASLSTKCELKTVGCFDGVVFFFHVNYFHSWTRRAKWCDVQAIRISFSFFFLVQSILLIFDHFDEHISEDRGYGGPFIIVFCVICVEFSTL